MRDFEQHAIQIFEDAGHRGVAGMRGGLAVEAAFSVTRCTLLATESAALSLRALATSPILKFMPLSVARVIFCTSNAWMVAPSAFEFWSSQAAFSSAMRAFYSREFVTSNPPPDGFAGANKRVPKSLRLSMPE